MVHLHARDADGCHSLDADLNQHYLDVVRAKVGDRLILQLTTESVGRYSPAEQMNLLRRCRPEAASIALREIVPDKASEAMAQDFFQELVETGMICQLIMYSAADIHRYFQLVSEQVLNGLVHHLLLVIGRHASAQGQALTEMLACLHLGLRWAVCAFGKPEYRLTTAAMALNGDVRVGFENNRWSHLGCIAEDNAQLVRQSVQMANLLNRPVLSAQQFRELMRLPIGDDT